MGWICLVFHLCPPYHVAMQTLDYLRLVRDWSDPYAKPVLEVYDGVTVVRDDLLEAGSKMRFIDLMIASNADVKEWVYGSSPRCGYGQISLAAVCKRYGKRCTLFLAKSKELHPNSARAKKYGANIEQVGTGFMKVCQARATEYVNADAQRRRLVPFGLADDTVFASIIKVARSLNIEPDEVWTAAGSGVLNRGLQLAWPKAKCVMVSVGHQLTENEIQRADVIRHYLKFEQSVKAVHQPPFPSASQYDAKAWEFVKARSDRKKKVLFWNVGA
jgi:hypothetical protein